MVVEKVILVLEVVHEAEIDQVVEEEVDQEVAPAVVQKASLALKVDQSHQPRVDLDHHDQDHHHVLSKDTKKIQTLLLQFLDSVPVRVNILAVENFF